MKRHHWFLIIGLCIGMLLGGVKCSFNVTQTPSAPALDSGGAGEVGR